MQTGSFYDTYIDWYPLLDPRDDHAEECAEFQARFEEVMGDGEAQLLELGGGAGNNATFLKDRFRCVVTDLSPAMLTLAEAANPECEHLLGDMRTLRLKRTFDAVLLHDAVCHLTSREDLLAALRTVAAHLRSGGVALVVPDTVAESFEESTEGSILEDDEHGLQVMVRSWDPDPDDECTRTDYACLLRDSDGVRAVHMVHEEGLFSVDTWRELIEAAGLSAELVDRRLPEEFEDGPYWDQMWRCRKP